MNIVEGDCQICGSRQQVRHALVRWAPPIRPTFEAVDRCADVAGCRERVMLAGDEWPVVEREPAYQP